MCVALDAQKQATLSSSIRVGGMEGPWIQPMVLRVPLHAMTLALRACATAFISDLAVYPDTLPWSVLPHQFVRLMNLGQ
jgi:hypothetical protein